MGQPGSGEVQGTLPIGECTYHARAPHDLRQDVISSVIGADAPPVLLGEAVVGQRFIRRSFGDLRQPLLAQLGQHLSGIITRGRCIPT